MPVLIRIEFRVQGHRGNGFRETCEVKCFFMQTQMQDQPETQRTRNPKNPKEERPTRNRTRDPKPTNLKTQLRDRKTFWMNRH